MLRERFLIGTLLALASGFGHRVGGFFAETGKMFSGKCKGKHSHSGGYHSKYKHSGNGARILKRVHSLSW